MCTSGDVRSERMFVLKAAYVVYSRGKIFADESLNEDSERDISYVRLFSQRVFVVCFDNYYTQFGHTFQGWRAELFPRTNVLGAVFFRLSAFERVPRRVYITCLVHIAALDRLTRIWSRRNV